MSDSENNKTQDRGDNILKRMLKTPPEPKGKGDSSRRRPPVSEEDRKDGSDAE